jgi:hypothetical protein
MRRPSGAHVQGAPFGSICLLLQWAQNLLSRRDSSWMHTRPVHAYVLPRQHQRTLQRQRLLLLPLPKITDRRRDYTTSSSRVDRSIHLIVVELMNKFFLATGVLWKYMRTLLVFHSVHIAAMEVGMVQTKLWDFPKRFSGMATRYNLKRSGKKFIHWSKKGMII